jgi:Uma2 family endonuclease
MPRPIAREGNPPTLADLLERLGGIGPERVVLRPPPGMASEADLVWLLDHGNWLYELVDGTLVAKVLSCPDSALTAWLVRLLWDFVDADNLGVLVGPDGPLRLRPGLVFLPDVSFIRREKLPGGRIPREPILDRAPDLAVEVLSEGNTVGKMKARLKEYFQAGTTLVWLIDRRKRTVVVYPAPDVSRTLTEADTLDGGDVLPGLELPVRRIFERLGPAKASPSRRARRKNPGAESA